jgi:putative transposase
MHNTYPSSISEQQITLIDGFFPRRSSMGRPLVHGRRTILNAIFYVIRSGCPWRYLPHDFPPWQTVYGYFCRWKRDGLWDIIHDVLVKQVWAAHGKHTNPTAAILDSQSVKIADQAGERGYDAGKKINGRKRHLLVDTLGLILHVVVTPASVQDRDGARLVLGMMAHFFSRMRVVWADGGYDGQLVEWLWCLRTRQKIRLEIVKRSDRQRGFAVLPKRWIVERTLGWLMKNRRLRCDYEQLTATSEAMIRIAMIRLMLRRLHPQN